MHILIRLLILNTLNKKLAIFCHNEDMNKSYEKFLILLSDFKKEVEILRTCYPDSNLSYREKLDWYHNYKKIQNCKEQFSLVQTLYRELIQAYNNLHLKPATI